MRIAFVLPALKPGGGVRVVFEHANRLQQRGHQVSIASLDGDTVQRWFPLAVPIISRGELLRQAADCDVVVATGWQTASICLSLPARARVYYVQMFESLFYQDCRMQRDAYATYQWPFDGFVTISQWLQRMLAEEFGQASVIVPNGVNRAMFFPEPRFPRRGRVRVLIEGSLNHYKGVAEAFAALAGLPVEVWALSTQRLNGPIDRLFVSPSQDTIRRIYSSCDILLKTSWYEGRPCPHVEAMACGCAVISSQMYGTDDLVDGYNALLVPARDVAATRAALLRLIEDEALRQRLIQGGFETVQRLDWEESSRQMEEALGDILAGQTRPVAPPACHVVCLAEAPLSTTRRALSSLRRACGGQLPPLTAIVDGRQPELAEYLAGEGATLLHRNESGSDAAVWRRAVEQARGQPILLLSSSVRLDDVRGLTGMLERLAADPQLGILGPKLLLANWTIASAGGCSGPAARWALDDQRGHIGWHQHFSLHNEACEVDWVDGRCALIAAPLAQALLDEADVCPLGEGMFAYSRRARQRGWRCLYFPQLVGWLPPEDTSLEQPAFEDLQQLDVQTRRRIAMQRGLMHYLRVLQHDVRAYGVRWVVRRAVNWLKWIMSGS